MRVRFALALALLAAPAYAWEFRPTPICTLSLDREDVDIAVTYDHATQDYAIAVSRPDGWSNSPIFALRFDGPARMTISTDRHQISTDGTTLSVTDKGFGNVLNGIERNNIATAMLGNTAVPFPLTGAAPEVEAFRACTVPLAV